MSKTSPVYGQGKIHNYSDDMDSLSSLYILVDCAVSQLEKIKAENQQATLEPTKVKFKNEN